MPTRNLPAPDDEQAMKLKEAALAWLNDLSAHGILVTDAELNICGWNQWLERNSGHTAEEMVGRNLLEAYPDLISRRLHEYFHDALERQVRVVSQRLHRYLLPMKPGLEDASAARMQQTARIAPLIADDKVIGTITLIDDVTERVERENRLVELLANEKSARAEAEAANRAKDEFLATVSHELRTPLNAISGWVQILQAGKLERAAAARALEAIERGAQAQEKLVNDILDAARIITGKLSLEIRPVDVASVIEAALHTVGPAADAKSIKLNAIIDHRAGPVSADPNRLQQVVWNLLFNAIKFTPRFGTVTVSLDRVDSEVQLTVSDTGQGISAEFLPYVFDRFRQADSSTARSHGGLGLGLAIVRQVVELHGGRVSAYSEGPGLGATFTVSLPLLAVHIPEELLTQDSGDAAYSRTRGLEADLPRLDDARVLVVDDESDAREIINIMLTQCGAESRMAGSAREALDVLAEWKPDVLVSDVGMPEEDGYLLIRKIRALEAERGGRIPAVALTGYAGPEDRVRLLSAGYQMHITKPVELQELAIVVANLLNEKRRGSR
jgi:PAS domain S-box-containing protein